MLPTECGRLRVAHLAGSGVQDSGKLDLMTPDTPDDIIHSFSSGMPSSASVSRSHFSDWVSSV
jgi:hypothetical protein